MVETLTFIVLALLLICSAIMIVLKKNLFHATLFLMLFLFTMAGMYIHLQAELVASIQVLAYVGGVTTFILFVLMLTKKVMDLSLERFNRQRIPGLVVMALIFIAFTVTALFTFLQPMTRDRSGFKITEITISKISDKTVTNNLMPLLNKEFSEEKSFRSHLLNMGFNEKDIEIILLHSQISPVPDLTVIGKLLVTDYLLSFEIISLILTVSMIGAILLVKREES